MILPNMYVHGHCVCHVRYTVGSHSSRSSPDGHGV